MFVTELRTSKYWNIANGKIGFTFRFCCQSRMRCSKIIIVPVARKIFDLIYPPSHEAPAAVFSSSSGTNRRLRTLILG